jgi:hypothetical protein
MAAQFVTTGAPSLVNAAVCSIEKKVEDIDGRLAKLKQQIASARTPAAKNAAKSQAMRLLKQKKVYLSQLDQVGAQQLNLESANFMAQQMKDTADQVAVMKEVKQTIHSQMQAVSIDDVEALQEDMADLYVCSLPSLTLSSCLGLCRPPSQWRGMVHETWLTSRRPCCTANVQTQHSHSLAGRPT